MYIHRMAKRYSIAEARSNLPAIVDQAEAGQEIELTRRGKPVAVVVSLREFSRRQNEGRGFSDAYKKFLKKYSLKEIGLEEDFFRAIREKDAGREVSL
jgi:prevent-host-death family protein